jgi:predicted ATPase/predicted negative regulator of RcsB-dependent stress response
VRDLPTGTVTLLFTDIEGSTRLLDELGERYADVLMSHQRALREAFQAHGGVEVSTHGDAFFYAFERATDAVAAAGEGQAKLAGGPVRVRMGLHTGEPNVIDGDYVGPDVHRAARIMAAGHGGQVLLSQTTRDLVDSAVELRDLGEHLLKDISAPIRLFQLGDGEFPPLRSLSQAQLPAALEPLVGRKRELAELVQLFRRGGARLVTLTGPGGIGKTRLALAVAADLVESFEDGVTVVELASVTDPDHVLPAVAEAVGVHGEIEAHFGSREHLLVLDNLEQVVAVAPRLSRLLSACSGLRILATSREALRISGEREVALTPLPEAPAVELFRRRAEAIRPGFTGDYAVLAEICRRVDSLPLAIELAAARVKVLSPDELLARLEQRLPLLASRARDLPERQRTLRAAIEWSHDLLSEEERRLFRRLSVFAGGWTLPAAEEICETDLDLLESLVDKSLVRKDGERFTMLETIREYAAERLAECGGAEELRRRHASYFLALAERVEEEQVDAGPTGWRERLRPEWDNYRAAFAWTLETGEAELGLRLAAAVSFAWLDRNLLAEGNRLFEALFAAAPDVDELVRAKALSVWAMIASVQSDWTRTTELGEEALALYRRAGHPLGAAWALMNLAVVPLEFGRTDEARAMLDEAHGLLRSERNRSALVRIGHLYGQLAAETGDAERAREQLRESTDRSLAAGEDFSAATTLHSLGDVELTEGAIDAAAEAYAEALQVAWKTGASRVVCYALAGLAAVAAERGRPEEAAFLWGFVERYEERLTFTLRRRARYADRLDAPAAAYPERWQAGRDLDVGAAVEYALSLAAV